MAAHDERTAGRWRRTATFWWTSLSLALLLLTLLLAAFLLVVPRAAGAVPLTILTGSMQPTMPPGTMAIVRPVGAADLGVGQVVTFQVTPDDPTLVTHRVIEVSRTSSGGTVLVTQGDNNGAADPAIKAEQVMGKVEYAVPYMGWLSTSINSEAGVEYRTHAAYGLLGYALLSFVAGLISYLREKRGLARRHRRETALSRKLLGALRRHRPARHRADEECRPAGVGCGLM